MYEYTRLLTCCSSSKNTSSKRFELVICLFLYMSLIFNCGILQIHMPFLMWQQRKYHSQYPLQRIIFVVSHSHTGSMDDGQLAVFNNCSVSNLINLRMDAKTIISRAFERGTKILRLNTSNRGWDVKQTEKKCHFIIMIFTWTVFCECVCMCFALSLFEWHRNQNNHHNLKYFIFFVSRTLRWLANIHYSYTQ